MPFLNENWNLIFPSFISIIAPIVLRKGLPRIIGHVGLQSTLQKKDTSVTFWTERFFFCHTYDTSMTIIVTKPGIIIDVVGSYFYDKKSWQKMGFSSWAGQRRSCMTFFGPSMTEKTMVEARARKLLVSSRLRWVVGGRAMHVNLVHVHACVRGVGSNWTQARRWALTEP